MAALGLPDPESLSLEAQVAQLIVVRASGYLFDHQRQYPQWELANADLRHCVETRGVGGVILLGGSAVEVGLRSQQLQSWAEIPLLVAADIEEGVGQRFSGATQFPPPMALAAVAQQDIALACQYAEQMGAVTAQEAIAIGLNWILAPVADVNNNPHNPVINVRAFGDTPDLVSQLSQAFIRGTQQFPVLTTAKHFPGHGDTDVDSHLHLPVIAHDRTRLNEVELAPFKAAIALGIDTIMTAHVQVPILDAHLPATLSPKILSQLLRQELGFAGIVVTDALIMGAIVEAYGPYEAAVLAIEAGADVLLMPPDPEGTLQSICEAVRTGRLGPERILTSVERLWRAKQKVSDRLTIPPESCHAWEHIPPPAVQIEALSTVAAQHLAQDIIQASTQTQGQIPALAPGAVGRSLIIVDDLLGTHHLSRHAPAIVIPSQLGFVTYTLDNSLHSLLIPRLVEQHFPTILQIFCRGNPFRGSAHLSQSVLKIFESLQESEALAGLVVYGSPYVQETLLGLLSQPIPFGFTFSTSHDAQAAILSNLLHGQRSDSGKGTFTD